MADIQEIVNFINAELKRKQFTAKRFQKGTFVDTLVELIPTKDGDADQTKPCTVADDGECTDVIIDDVHPIQVYHRIASYNSAKAEEENDFGNPVAIAETYNMRMVVIGDREKVLLTKEKILTGIGVGFPLEVPKATRATLLSQLITIELGDVEVVSATVWQEEYSGVEDLLKPQVFMFAFNYIVTTTINQACFVLCG